VRHFKRHRIFRLFGAIKIILLTYELTYLLTYLSKVGVSGSSSGGSGNGKGSSSSGNVACYSALIKHKNVLKVQHRAAYMGT
jgi:hypothetical protein